MLLISAIRICHVCRVGYSIICTTCDLVLSRIYIPGAHEGRRPEGASNGGSKCSAGCKYYALADITLLRFDVRAFAHTYVYMLRALRVPKS